MSRINKAYYKINKIRGIDTILRIPGLSVPCSGPVFSLSTCQNYLSNLKIFQNFQHQLAPQYPSKLVFFILAVNNLFTISTPPSFSLLSKYLRYDVFFVEFGSFKAKSWAFNTYCLSPQAYCLNALFYLHQSKFIFRPTSSHWISTFIGLWKAYNKTSRLHNFCKEILKKFLHRHAFRF